MSEAKFTKGNWATEYIGDVAWIVSSYDNFNKGLAKVTFCGVSGQGTMKANVNLISAAPDMLEALLSIENDDGTIPEAIWELRNKAIAKALGEL